MSSTTRELEAADQVEIRHGDRSIRVGLLRGTEGEEALDLRRLRRDTGWIGLDPGFANTGSCRSAITFVDGENGILRYRGYPIEELAERSTFLEVAWLLMRGDLPSAAELAAFEDEVTHHTMPHEDFKRFLGALPSDAHPMPTLAAAVGALATFYSAPVTDEEIDQAAVRLIAKLPTLAAYAYKRSIGQPYVPPQNHLDYTSNFLNMMYATPCEPYEVDPVVARALDLLLILHADHEQNCSTSTVRLVGSSQAHLFAGISAGISALWGPLHGGANQKVIEMLESIAAEEGSAQRFLERAKDKDDTTRLMGFGHRVYKSYDPRAAILKKACKDVLDKLDGAGRLLEIAMELEEITLADEYFISRKLYPNVDFYSGVIYKAIGIPINMFTVMFALGRLPGWIAHWMEMRRDSDFRIGRPRQLYIGPNERHVPERG